jgi:hypothetical protein
MIEDVELDLHVGAGSGPVIVADSEENPDEQRSLRNRICGMYNMSSWQIFRRTRCYFMLTMREGPIFECRRRNIVLELSEWKQHG